MKQILTITAIIFLLAINIVAAELTAQEKEELRIENNRMIKEAQDIGKLYELSEGEVILKDDDINRLFLLVLSIIIICLLLIIYIARSNINSTKI